MATMVVALGLVAVGWGGAVIVVHGRNANRPAESPVKLTTATVTRTDLIAAKVLRGSLSYASFGAVTVPGTGTVTELPRVGQPIQRGAPLLSIDGNPVAVLFGSTPLYRVLRLVNTSAPKLEIQSAEADLLLARATLNQARDPHLPAAVRNASKAQDQIALTNAEHRLANARAALRQAQTPLHGPDVALVAGNLAAMGFYRGSTSTWSASLQRAVRRWQQLLGAAVTGHIDPARVVVVAGRARVSAVQGRTGDSVAAVSITLSAPTIQGTFTVSNGLPAALAQGRAVTVSLNSGTALAGQVVSIVGGPSSTTVVVDLAAAPPSLNPAPVTMRITTAIRHNVLVVPVQALLALVSGGYALQLPHGGLVPVHTGLIQNGSVEIDGAGIHAGLRVVSAA